jgi:hypothetical protein
MGKLRCDCTSRNNPQQKMAAQFVTQMAAAIIETSPIDQFSEEQRHIPQKIIRFASQVMVKTTESYDA